MKPNYPIAADIEINSRDILNDLVVRKPKRSPAKFFLALILWFSTGCSGGQSHGTAAFAFWTPAKIVLAADSKVNHMDGELASQTCKIRAFGKFYFAASGFYRNPSTGYDLWQFAQDELPKAMTVPKAALSLESAVSVRLNVALDEVRRNNPIGFKREFSQTYLAFVIAGIDNERLALSGRSFHPDGIERVAYPQPGRTEGIGFIEFGEHSAVDGAYTAEAFRTLLSGDLVEAARRLVLVEIEATPEKVGPPTTILEIRTSGINWVERGVCKPD